MDPSRWGYFTEIKDFEHLEEEKRMMVEFYETSMTKIQHVPYYMRNLKKYEKYYFPNLISIGPAHAEDSRLLRGMEYKLMWMLMYAKESQKTPNFLFQKILEKIEELRRLFTPEVMGHLVDSYLDPQLAYMLLVDGCAVLQIMEKANLSKLEDLIVKVDIQVIARDLFLLENQLPYELLKLLSEDESKLKKSMYQFCKLQRTFTISESPHAPLFREPEHQLETLLMSSQPTHLLDCLRTYVFGIGMDSINKDECRVNVRQLEADIANSYANKKEKYISYRNIQELKAAGIQVKRQENISPKNISFSSSLFGGKLYIPPLIFDDSTVTILLNLLAYEMCSDFKNTFEICSFVKLLDLLIDSAEDVKELRSSRVLHNSLGSDEELVEFFNTISPGLLQNPNLYSGVKEVMEIYYKKKLSMWIAEAYYTYFKSPWTIIAFLAALIVLVLTALQTWQAFVSNSK
ncbi:hypothetical protein L6164_007821 [Bauhinia variegata]|uniref:Uncharacterized protein n=1 Tax=Bauhinia variegata TaxID=167791 RepID=A0ACB9PEK4_BAUVA|nr:hypothetical protein L6164_007821 [Bauhinia variegata]